MTAGFESLYDAHVAMLTGSFLNGVERGPEGASYAWSEKIPDPTMNFGCGIISLQQFDWAIETAKARGRAPAFLARDDAEVALLSGICAPEAVHQASWMVASDAGICEPEPDLVCRTASATMPGGFETVFGALSDDPAICEHVCRYYVASLREASVPPDVEPLHLVLDDEGEPVACASLYLRDGLAGLYNVSTRADRQRRGFGAAITRAALEEAFAREAACVFLQCPASGPVERLYVRVGFQVCCSPSLVCMPAQ